MSYPDYDKKVDAKTVVPGFITVDEALDCTTRADVDRAKADQLAHNNQYRTAAAMAIGAGDVCVKAEGAYWWDVDGVKHLDFIGSVGPALLGLNNPFVVDAVKKYLDKHLITMDPLMLHQTTAAFSANMAKIVPYLPRAVICCGGAEANETLLKMLRIAAYRTKKGKPVCSLPSTLSTARHRPPSIWAARRNGVCIKARICQAIPIFPMATGGLLKKN